MIYWRFVIIVMMTMIIIVIVLILNIFFRVAPRYIHSSLPSNPLDIFAFPNSTISLLPFLRLMINSLSRNQLARGCVKIKVNLKKRQNTLF